MSTRTRHSVYPVKSMATLQGPLAGWMGAAALEAGTGALIESLVADYSQALYRVAYSVTRNAAEAEDAVQETFLRVLRHQARLAAVRDLRVWLVRITWNIVLDRKRRAKTRPETDDVDLHARTLAAAGLAADEEAIGSQQHERILNLMQTLPRKEREALLLSAIDELTTPEIASVLNTTESTIRSRIFRARRLMAGMLEKEGITR